MDREAIVLYLQNVRDLEVARYSLSQKYNREKSAYTSKRQNLLRPAAMYKNPKKPVQDSSMGALLAYLFIGTFFMMPLIVFIIGFLSSQKSLSDYISREWESTTGVMILSLCTVIGIFFYILAGLNISKSNKEINEDMNEWKQTVAANEEHNTREIANYKNRQAAVPALDREWAGRVSWYQAEEKKVQDLLDSFYNMNLIPVQFRELSAVCYICEYMSTSRESLTTALFSQHIEDGIRRIEAKLDSVISSLEDLIYETRCMRAENQRNIERIIQKNNAMLESLQQSEQNTLASAQYSELAANYSKANAYFSLANYLKS